VPPFPAGPLLAYLHRRRTPDLETVEPGVYRRRTPSGEVTVSFGPTVSLAGAHGPPTAPELAGINRLFRLHESWDAPPAFIRDPLLGPLVAGAPGYRPLGCWEPFELCLRTVVGQQVSVAAAGTLMARLGQRAGSWSPQAVAAADLTNLGMPGKRAATLRALAEQAADHALPWDDWPSLREALARLPGFGPWTLDYLALRLGRDLDAFPATDLGLLKQSGSRTPKELLARAEAWRPLRGWAAAYLWMPSPALTPPGG
jgi:3-methyladenine DNA glycosylase/8-oxoguanine DNA glycosylase